MKPKTMGAVRALASLLGITCWSIVITITFHRAIYQYCTPKVGHLFSEQQLALILQGIATILIFMGSVAYYIWKVEKHAFHLFFRRQPAYLSMIPLVIGIVLFSMALIALIETGNFTILPHWLTPLKEWLKAHEAIARAREIFLTTFHCFTDYSMGMVVIALLPAIGEELFLEEYSKI